ncbi:MAG TPA: nitroreductase family protein [Patescibacteria group bacterium]|nr:nitroreductase family protein [Patescibacteria group bacterium]
MAVRTTRTREEARVTIDHARCRQCGLCVAVCGMTLTMQEGRVRVTAGQGFGCIGCGQCMAVCPEGCINVEGRTLTPQDVWPLSPAQAQASYESLRALMVARRGVRKYKEQNVEPATVEQILAAAAMAPMGLPPSDVSVMVLENREKVEQFSDDFVEYIKRKRWLFSAPAVGLLRPFIGRETAEMMTDFVRPFMDLAIEGKKRGEDFVLYGAPLAMLFQASPYSDPADPHIAATYAMLAAEALGLGTCMIGTVAPVLKHAGALKAKYSVRPDMRQGLMVLFGYPAISYSRGIRRTFARIDYV